MLTLLPAPATCSPERPRRQFKMAEIVLTPDNRVAIVCGRIKTPDGLMAFVVDATVPAGKRRSVMVPYDSLRPAERAAKPRLVMGTGYGDRRNPFAGFERARVEVVAPSAAVDHGEAPKALAVIAPEQRVERHAQIPAFLRAHWPRDRENRRLKPYPAGIATLALAAFRIWPAQAARLFDTARVVEAARLGVIRCSVKGQSVLARAASARREI